ncbi:hypothetical protein LY76DRAFT_591698 [Colletotrichum caudatum]|nr:hypothetical protein LY76DRAFT_591698 [Colletotrichum caudatum]
MPMLERGFPFSLSLSLSLSLFTTFFYIVSFMRVRNGLHFNGVAGWNMRVGVWVGGIHLSICANGDTYV